MPTTIYWMVVSFEKTVGVRAVLYYGGVDKILSAFSEFLSDLRSNRYERFAHNAAEHLLRFVKSVQGLPMTFARVPWNRAIFLKKTKDSAVDCMYWVTEYTIFRQVRKNAKSNY
jgi:hypothetical protein